MDDTSHKKDPYLSELDAMGDLEPPPQEPAAPVEGPFDGEAPTRVDMKVPPAPRKSPKPAPPSAETESEPTVVTEGAHEIGTEASEPLPEGPVPIQELLDLSPDLSVPVIVVMGRKSVTVKDLLALRMGQVVDLNRNPSEPVDLVAAGKVIGKGELVEIDGQLGVRILKLLK